jgi:hypothetical protein
MVWCKAAFAFLPEVVRPCRAFSHNYLSASLSAGFSGRDGTKDRVYAKIPAHVIESGDGAGVLGVLSVPALRTSLCRHDSP